MQQNRVYMDKTLFREKHNQKHRLSVQTKVLKSKTMSSNTKVVSQRKKIVKISCLHKRLFIVKNQNSLFAERNKRHWKDIIVLKEHHQTTALNVEMRS